MKKKKLLIAGDSFATDWTKKYKNNLGWVNFFENDFLVTNVAQAGVSEYKIFKQIEKINPKNYDEIIISHTSPYRIPIEEHPIHKDDILHNNCDLIYSDIQAHLDNDLMKLASEFYNNFFYFEYFRFTHKLISDEICKKMPYAHHITFFDDFYDEKYLKFGDIFKDYAGNINHLSEYGNQIVYKSLKKIITN